MGQVGRFIADDVTAEVKDGKIQQAMLYQVKQIQNPSGPPVAIIKRVNFLELVMNQSHPYQRIETLTGRLVKKDQQPLEQFHDLVMILWRRVNHFSGGPVGHNRPRPGADARSWFPNNQGGLNGDQIIQSEMSFGSDPFEPQFKRSE